MISVNRPEFLAAQMCTARNGIRPSYNGIWIDPEGYILGNDGHIMFCGKALTDGETAIIELMGKPPAKFSHVNIDITERKAFFIDNESTEIRHAQVDIMPECMHEWRRIVSCKPDHVSEIGVSFELLAKAAKCAKLFNKKSGLLILSGAGSPMRLNLGEDAYMMIMPTKE